MTDPAKKQASGRFDYVAYDEQSKTLQAEVKRQVEQLESTLNVGLANGRAKSLAFTALEEFYMWVGKSIRDNQILRSGEAHLEEGRSNS